MIVFALLAALVGCTPGRPLQRTLVPPAQVASVTPKASPVLKAHMRDGTLYVFSKWATNDGAATVTGTGRRLAVDRVTSTTGTFDVRLADAALFESNAPIRGSAALTALTVITGASLVGTALCAANPKSCFGSCPTFYVTDGERSVLQAEGFSDSISPALEATDIDALFRARPGARRLEVRMTNEALETHVVKAVDILAVPRPAGGRVVYAAGDGFFAANALRAAERCEAAEGSCEEAVRTLDGRERSSLADDRDLATAEELKLVFPAAGPGEDLGLVVAARQSLMTTFLLYQGLAYLGSQATAALSELERNPALKARVEATHRLLGGIEVSVRDEDGEWEKAGEIFETGPIATDVHAVRLRARGEGPVHVRLRLTRGNWRVDWVALATLGAKLEPVRVTPGTIEGSAEDGRRLTSKVGETIVTVPGDVYTMTFTLPEQPERYELFLSSRGYYLEWIRAQWLAEESQVRAAMMLYTPSMALRVLAPAYKRQEANMERVFWGSRYARP